MKQNNIYKNSKTQKIKNSVFSDLCKNPKKESLYLCSLKKPKNCFSLKNQETKKSKSDESEKNLTQTGLRLLPCLTLF
jgi:hypothetical protein